MRTLLLMFFGMLPVVSGGGRMRSPPSRASMWRDGYLENGENYDDNQMFCGGFSHQQSLGGACGICGDPYDASPREHEAGGRYANGIITGTYVLQEVLNVSIQITAHHRGYFEFRLCAHNDPSTAATQECLDTHLLPLLSYYNEEHLNNIYNESAQYLHFNGSEQYLHYNGNTRYLTPVNTDDGWHYIQLELPEDLTCTQCVLQWKYVAGNSWGVDPETGEGCVGCGAQEEFYACSDIEIITEEERLRRLREASTVPTTIPTTISNSELITAPLVKTTTTTPARVYQRRPPSSDAMPSAINSAIWITTFLISMLVGILITRSG